MLLTCLLLPIQPAWSHDEAPPHRLVLIRDAETETLMHAFAVALYRAASLNPNTIRIFPVRDRAINAFAGSGNRMFIHAGLVMQADAALGDRGQANLVLAKEAIRVGDIRLAKRFARMAADSLPQGPARLRALDIGNAARKENRE